MNNTPAVLILKKGREDSIKRRHPWIFSGAVAKINGAVQNGDVVTVKDHKNSFLCKGHYQDATIKVRILTYEDIPIDADFYHSRLERAYNHRIRLSLPDNHTNMFRLIHGDGDLLPGLIVDCYDNVMVLQSHSTGMTKDAPVIVEALKRLYGEKLDAVYRKSADRESGSGGAYVYIRDGLSAEDLKNGRVCKENGFSFHINWESGQKTGFFLDQRDNRKLIGSLSRGMRVLNTFCYTGGFSVYAIGEGASEVVSVDSSKKAMELTEENIGLLEKKEGTHKSICADVMDVLKNSEETFDIVILDPPAFAKHVKSRHNAIQGYKRLNRAAIPKVEKGGLLCTFSCSQVVSHELFEGAVRAAAIESGRHIQILQRLGHPADHPVSLFHPEGEYLKGLLLKVY